MITTLVMHKHAITYLKKIIKMKLNKDKKNNNKTIGRNKTY